MTLRFGGLVVSDDNIKNKEGFEYMIEAPQTAIFGAEIYPSIYMKAAVYMRSIICSHVFHDGNKRTGLESGLLFLEKNNVLLKSDVASKELVDFATKVGHCEISLEDVAKWFEENTVSFGFASLNKPQSYEPS
jgi:death on curing protein